MKNVFTKLILFVLVIGLLIGCAPAPQPALTDAPTLAPSEVSSTDAPTTEPTHIKVSILPFLSYTPLFIAQEEGYFAAQNLEVEFVNLTGGQELPVALVSGQIDVGIGFISVGLMNAMGQDVKVQIVADKGYLDPQGCTSAALLARKDLVVNGELNISADQVKSIKASYAKTNITEYFFDTLMSPSGINTTDVPDIFIPYNELAEAIKTDNMDLVMMAEPWVTRILKTDEAVILKDYKQDFPNAEFSVLIYGPALLEGNVDAGNRFMTAYLQGVKKYQEGATESNMKIANQYTKLEPAELKSLCWQPIRADGVINTQTIVDFQDWAVKKGYLQTAVPVETFWNPSFVEFAQSQLK